MEEYLVPIARTYSTENEKRYRRERIARAIIGGFLSNPQWRFQPDETAKAALLFADALIAELDKKEN